MTVIKKVTVQIGADTSGLKKGLDDADKQLKKLATSLKKISAVALGSFAAVSGALALMANEMLKLGDAVDKGSKKLGMSSGEYQTFVAVLDDMGINSDAASQGILNLRNQLGKGKDASKEFQAALSQIGLKPEDLLGKTALDQYKLISERLRSISKEQQSTVARGLLGRAGNEIGKLVNAPPGDVAKAERRFAASGGPLFAAGEAEHLADIGDELTALGNAGKQVRKQLTFAIFGEVNPEDIRKITEAVAEFAGWVKENARLVKIVTVAFLAMAGAVGLVGAVIAGVITAVLVPFAGVAAAVTAAIGGLAAGITTLVLYWDDLGDAIKLVWNDLKNFVAYVTGGVAGKVLGLLGFGDDSFARAAAAGPSPLAPRAARAPATVSGGNTTLNVVQNISSPSDPNQIAREANKRLKEDLRRAKQKR